LRVSINYFSCESLGELGQVVSGPIIDRTTAGRAVVEALAGLPAGPELLRAAARTAGVHLVGGAVRDILLGGQPRELDVVVDGDPAALIASLVAAGRGDAAAEVVHHARFGTASVALDGGRIDIARSRRERYPRPGALPDVEPAPLADDLRRRDFTVNAIAVSLPDGAVTAVPDAFADLQAGRLRVLHDESFRDDPTRLLRLARLRVRLGFTVEPRTAELAAAADLGTVSGARIGAELRLALAEPDPVDALAAYAELPGLPLDVDRRLLRRACDLLGAAGRPELLLLAGVTRRRGDPEWLGGLELTAADRDAVLAGWEAGTLARAIAAAGSPSELGRLLAGRPIEAVALAGALGPAAAVTRWLDELRHVGLEIDGDDLIAAGVAPGPELGRRLEWTLARKLDGLLPAGREAELLSALSPAAVDDRPVGEPGPGAGGPRPSGHRRLQPPDRRRAKGWLA
jgi:tRNA nucleotidyltransferase (CCA-adding enzyme)